MMWNIGYDDHIGEVQEMRMRFPLLVSLILTLAMLTACSNSAVTAYIESLRPEGFTLGETIKADLDGDDRVEYVVTFASGTEKRIYLVQRTARGYAHDHLHTAVGLLRGPEIINLDSTKARFVLIGHGPRASSSVELHEGYSIYGMQEGRPKLIDEHIPSLQKTRSVFRTSNRWLVLERFVCDHVQGHIVGITYAWQDGRFVSLGEHVSYPNRAGPVYNHITEPETAIRGYIEASSLESCPWRLRGTLLTRV